MNWRKTNTIAFCLLFCISGLLFSSLFPLGITVSPIRQSVSPRDSGHCIVKNKGDYPIAIEVFAESATMTEEGKEECRLTEDLLIYPAQSVIKPGKERRIQIKARQTDPIPCERMYRLVVREIPLRLDENQPQGVFLACSYRLLFFLLPQKPFSRVKVTKAWIDNNQLHLQVDNSGNCHTHFNPITIEYKKGKKKLFPLSEESLKKLENQYLAAQSRRHFILDLLEPVDHIVNNALVLRCSQNKKTLSVPFTLEQPVLS